VEYKRSVATDGKQSSHRVIGPLKDEALSLQLSARGCDTEMSLPIAEGFFNEFNHPMTQSLNILSLATSH
jgi:hypothetical protein